MNSQFGCLNRVCETKSRRREKLQKADGGRRSFKKVWRGRGGEWEGKKKLAGLARGNQAERRGWAVWPGPLALTSGALLGKNKNKK